MYADVFDVLEREGVRYVVVGGVAMVLRGCERETTDLDVVVDRSPPEAERALRALLSLGFVPTLPLGLGEVTVLPMLDREGRRIDVFARFRIPFDELWEGAELLPLAGGGARVASVADLVREKSLRGGPRDLADVEALHRASPATSTPAPDLPPPPRR